MTLLTVIEDSKIIHFYQFFDLFAEKSFFFYIYIIATARHISVEFFRFTLLNNFEINQPKVIVYGGGIAHSILVFI